MNAFKVGTKVRIKSTGIIGVIDCCRHGFAQVHIEPPGKLAGCIPIMAAELEEIIETAAPAPAELEEQTEITAPPVIEQSSITATRMIQQVSPLAILFPADQSQKPISETAMQNAAEIITQYDSMRAAVRQAAGEAKIS